jgi:hypothetical protein
MKSRFLVFLLIPVLSLIACESSSESSPSSDETLSETELENEADDDEDEPIATFVDGAPSLAREFSLPVPLFSPDSAWNQPVASAAVLPESDQQILATYRVLIGDFSTLEGYDEPATNWPYMDVNLYEYSMPIFRAGDGEQRVVICADGGVLGWPHPKFGIEQEGGPVTIPAPAGVVRPAGPEHSDSDGHLVLVDTETFIAYDLFMATVDGEGDCRNFTGGALGRQIGEAGVVDYFDMRGPGVNADGDYSARAHGTPLLAGLILPEDIESGVIGHALAFAIPGPRNLSRDPYEPLHSDYFYPASTTETDYYNTDPNALAAGQRIRLKHTLVDEEGDLINESELAPITHIFLAALRDYGAYLVDNAGGFSFYAEDVNTAVLDLSEDEINALIGQLAGTPLPEGMTKWQIVLERLGEDLERIPIAMSPGDEEPDPETAVIETANFEVVEPATSP